MPIDPSAIHRLLGKLPQRRSLDAALALFDALGYQYADELPLPTRTWPEGAQQLLSKSADPPIYLAQHGGFHVIYTHLTTDHLARTVERPVVEQTLHKLHPFALFVFANKDQSEWDFVNVKYVAEDGDRRRTIRRIHVGQAERLHTAAQRMALLAVPAPDTGALELQSLHDQAFDVEEVTRQFYRDYVEVFGQLCDDIAKRNPRRQDEAETEAQMLLDRLMFLYFIQKKGWLDDRRDYLYQQFKARYGARPAGTDFYSDLLVPLFVALSNEGMAFPSLGEIPFLNGGLFEVPADTQVAEHLVLGNAVFKAVFDDLLECYNFTVREDTPLDVEVAIDPEMLGQVFENLVLGLERGEDRRRATGSYYTPRVIVHFMCRQALKEYLAAETEVEPERIDRLMEAGPAEQLTTEDVAELKELVSEPEARLLRALVEKARVLDPAVGSGAFLVGMLHQMVALTKLLDVRLYGRARVRRRNYDYDLKRGFIERSLYGVDIQPEAVRICELRLWLSLMVEYERKPSEAVPTLPNLSYRVRVGDSLIERLFGEPVQLDELADDAVARQLIDRIQAEKRVYFQEPDLVEKQRRELRILGLLCELAAKLIGAKRGAVLQRRSAEVPGLFGDFGAGLLTDRQKQAKGEIETELARYDALMDRVKGVYERVGAMQDGHAPLGARDVDALREHLGLSFIWRLDFAEVFADRGGFDVVIGNPPYGTDLDSAQKEYLKRHFEYLVERIRNSFLYFLGKSYETATCDGIVCLILPNEFLFQIYMTKARRFFLTSVQMLMAINVGEDVFEAIVPTCIVAFKKTKRSTHPIAVADLRDCSLEELSQRLSTYAFPTILNQVIHSLPNAIFTFDQQIAALVSKLALQFPTFENFCDDIANGISTSCDEIYIVSAEFAERHRLEKQYLKQCIRGGQFSRYYCPSRTDDFILYITKDFDRHLGKYIYRYLLANKALLIRKCVEKRNGKRPWHVLFRSRYEGLFVKPKILIRQTADSIVAALDDEVGYYCIDSVNMALIGQEYVSRTRYILGLLNSALLRFYYQQISQEAGRVLAQVKPGRIKALPIADVPVPLQVPVVLLVDRILATRKRNPEADTKALEQEIDSLVYQLYGLTDEEIAIVEGA